MKGTICMLWVLLCGTFLACSAEIIADSSFTPPFEDIDYGGSRTVSGFRVGGHAQVKRHFVRLTPDRENKFGSLWAEEAVGVNEISFDVKFRISGTADTNFGEGIVVWITNLEEFSAGSFYGVTEKFEGVAVVVDTDRRDGAPHHDVKLVSSDGTKSVDDLKASGSGCDAKLRYFEERGDFSVFNCSVIRVSIRENSITLAVDPLNKKVWTDCATTSISLKNDWLKTARIGVTGRTDKFSDNHDILSLQVSDTPSDLVTSDDIPTDELESLKHRLEHEMSAIHDSLQININKLRKQENQAEGRIHALEDALQARLVESLDTRIKSLEKMNLVALKEQEDDTLRRVNKMEEALNSQVQTVTEGRIVALESLMGDKLTESLKTRIETLENTIERRLEQRLSRLEALMTERITSTVADVENESRGWRIPFGALAIAVLFGVGLVWWKYRVLQKQHSA